MQSPAFARRMSGLHRLTGQQLSGHRIQVFLREVRQRIPVDDLLAPTGAGTSTGVVHDGPADHIAGTDGHHD